MVAQQTEQKIMDRVAALLARAEHPNTPEAERELCFERANVLMAKHALDEAVIRSQQSASERRKPVSETWKWLETYSPYASYLRTVLTEIARTNRCRVSIHPGNYTVTVVGFSEDVSWTQMLYMNSYFAFLKALFPKWDETLGYDENVYNFKKAGHKWSEINHIARQHGHPDHEDRSTGRIKGAVIAAYKRHAKKIGDEQQITTQRHEAYRDTFAHYFVMRIGQRLEKMREENQRVADSAPGAMLALRDDVDAMFYELFPSLHPDEVRRRIEEQYRIDREAAEREARERQEMLNAMTPKQRTDFLEKEERQRRREAAASDRYWRSQTVSADRDGAAAGMRAADSVDLSRSTSVSKTDRKEIA